MKYRNTLISSDHMMHITKLVDFMMQLLKLRKLQ